MHSKRNSSNRSNSTERRVLLNEQANVSKRCFTMDEQSDFSQVTPDGVQNDTDHESEVDTSTSADTADSDTSGSSDITKLGNPAVESWIAERKDREEDYGYLHLFVIAKSDLTGVERHLQYENERRVGVGVGNDETTHQYGSRLGRGGVRASETRDRLIDWKLGELATPYHPDLRTVAAGNLRIFVADAARELLCEQNIDIDALVETLNHLDEHEPTGEQLAIRQKYNEAYEAVVGGSAPLKQQVRAVETTVRARFGFSRRYGGGIPDPHPDYQDLDPTALKQELESARNELEQTEQRKDDLNQKIADDKTQWIEEMRAQLFA
jgi:hypothetical protein